jgi:hypothetical protein
MAGRTVSKWIRFVIGDSAATIREVPIDSINGIGLDFPEKDVTAFQDAIRGYLPEQPNFNLTITGPMDTTAAVAAAASGAAPTLSGSQIVIPPLLASAAQLVPVSFGILIGILRYYTTGDPAFTLTKTATSGLTCTSYMVDSDLKYTAKFVLYPGSALPTWSNTIPT